MGLEIKGEEYYDLSMCKPTLKFKQKFTSIIKKKTPSFSEKGGLEQQI